MVTILRAKSQITLPKDVVNKLGLQTRDHLDIYEKNGVIHLVPVSVYPKEYIKELNEEITTIKGDIKDGKQPTFDNVDSLMKKLG